MDQLILKKMGSYLIEGQTNTQLSALKVQYPKMPDLSLNIDNYNLYINGIYQTPTFGLAVFKQLVYNNMFTNGLSGTIGLRLDYENSRIKHNTYSTDNLRGEYFWSDDCCTPFCYRGRFGYTYFDTS